MISFNRFFLDQHINGVSQLNFITSARRGFRQQRPDIGAEDITPHHRQVGRRNVSFWLLNHAHHRYAFARLQGFAFAVNHAISGYVFDRFNHNLAGASLIEARDHLSEVIAAQIGFIFIQNNVWQNNRDRLITHYRMGAKYRVPQTFRQALTNLHNGYVRRANRLHFFQQLAFYAFFQHRFQLKTGIEMVFDRVFGRVRYQNNFSNSCSDTFINNVLN